MFAIQNQRTKQFVYGTNFGWPRTQNTSPYEMLTYGTLLSAEYDFLHRECGSEYRIVELNPVTVKRVLPPVKDLRKKDE